MAAPVTFVDIAGIVKGASEGAGLGNKFLANIRECDAICQVVRVFADDDVVHVDGQVDPKSDIEVIETELILADMQTLERAVPTAACAPPRALAVATDVHQRRALVSSPGRLLGA